jgi:hypothetical protein
LSSQVHSVLHHFLIWTLLTRPLVPLSDESSFCDRDLLRSFAWSKQGTPSTQTHHNQNAERLSILTAISIDGLLSITTTSDIFNTRKFEDFLEFSLVSTLFLNWFLAITVGSNHQYSSLEWINTQTSTQFWFVITLQFIKASVFGSCATKWESGFFTSHHTVQSWIQLSFALQQSNRVWGHHRSSIGTTISNRRYVKL